MVYSRESIELSQAWKAFFAPSYRCPDCVKKKTLRFASSAMGIHWSSIPAAIHPFDSHYCQRTHVSVLVITRNRWVPVLLAMLRQQRRSSCWISPSVIRPSTHNCSTYRTRKLQSQKFRQSTTYVCWQYCSVRAAYGYFLVATITAQCQMTATFLICGSPFSTASLRPLYRSPKPKSIS